MSGKTFNFMNKTIKVAPGIKVICGGSVTEEDSGKESGSNYLCLITKRGIERLDSSPYFIDLQSATLEGNEIVIKWKRQEKHYKLQKVYHENFLGQEELIGQYHEEVIDPRECEKRFPIS